MLVVPFLVTPAVSRDEVTAELSRRWGGIEYVSPAVDFGYTSYYEPEMGPNLTRYIVGFETLIDPSELAEIKIRTNEIEAGFSARGRRRANLDPGLLGLERLVLASTKDNGRRIPLRDGIYAEITLIYHHGDFRPLEWTYPDYRSEAYLACFRELRLAYRRKLRAAPEEP